MIKRREIDIREIESDPNQWNQIKINKPFGSGRKSTGGASPALPPRLLVNRTGGAGGLSSSLDIIIL